MNVVAAVAVAAGALVVWLAAKFAVRPLLRFSALREQVDQQLGYYANIPVSPRASDYEFGTPTKIIKAEKVFRDLGTQMREFGRTETIAAWILGWWKISAEQAGADLISYSNNLRGRGPERAAHRDQIERALRLRRQSQ